MASKQWYRSLSAVLFLIFSASDNLWINRIIINLRSCNFVLTSDVRISCTSQFSLNYLNQTIKSMLLKLLMIKIKVSINCMNRKKDWFKFGIKNWFWITKLQLNLTPLPIVNQWSWLFFMSAPIYIKSNCILLIKCV